MGRPAWRTPEDVATVVHHVAAFSVRGLVVRGDAHSVQVDVWLWPDLPWSAEHVRKRVADALDESRPTCSVVAVVMRDA